MNTATLSFLNAPTGSAADANAARYSPIRRPIVSASTAIPNANTPIPTSPAIVYDCGLVAATQNGGCGSCNGNGTTTRSRNRTYSPSNSTGSNRFVQISAINRTDSNHISRVFP